MTVMEQFVAYWHLWLAVLVFGALYARPPKAALDLQLSNYYFVIGARPYALAGGGVLLVFGLAYWGMEQSGFQFLPWMKAVHLVISLPGILALSVFLYTSTAALPVRPRDPKLALAELERRQMINLGIVLGVVLLAAAQVLFLLNILTALWHGRHG